MTTKTGLAIGREALKRDELGANEKCRKPSGARQGKVSRFENVAEIFQRNELRVK